MMVKYSPPPRPPPPATTGVVGGARGGKVGGVLEVDEETGESEGGKCY